MPTEPYHYPKPRVLTLMVCDLPCLQPYVIEIERGMKIIAGNTTPSVTMTGDETPNFGNMSAGELNDLPTWLIEFLKINFDCEAICRL